MSDPNFPDPPRPTVLQYMSAPEYDLMSKTAGRRTVAGRPWLNAYVCPTCKNIRVSIDRDGGVTPARIRCDKCPTVKTIGKFKFPQSPRFMNSLFYKLPPGVTEQMAYYEFYRPTHDFYLAVNHVGTKRHIEGGGLLMRKIGEIWPVGYEGMLIRKV